MGTILTLDSLKLRPDERGALVGPTGCGKSHLAERLLPKSTPLLVVDPKRLFPTPKDAWVFSNARALCLMKPKRAVYRPKPEDMRDLAAYDMVYRYAYDRGNIMVYTDDVLGIMSRTRYPHYLQVCYQMGRAKNVAMLSAFQRPAWLPIFLLSEANKYYVFRMTLANDVKRIAEFIPGYDGTFKHRYEFVFYDVPRAIGPQNTLIISGG